MVEVTDAAACQREYRRRRREGKLVLRVTVDDVDLAAKLVALGGLRQGDEDNTAAVAEAVARLLAEIKVRYA